MLLGAVEQIKGNEQLLGRLDSFGGDGDHGTTMTRAMQCLQKGIDDTSSGAIKDMLNNVGWAVMGVDGGAAGPLFGSFFMGMASDGGDGDAVDASGLADMFEAGLTSVRNITKAKVGDKTMIDALVPAVEAARTAADAGADISGLLSQAVEAAETGAQSTKDMAARFGRAKNIGQQSKGHPDPGAMSVSFMFKGFAEMTNG